MAATTIYTGTLSGVSQTFTVSPGSRVSLTLKGTQSEQGRHLNGVECFLLYSDNGALVMDDGAVVLDARHNALELIHAGSFQMRVTNPNSLDITLQVE